MNRVVFLDYDGVVNRRMWDLVDGKWVYRFGYPEDGKVNDVQAVQWVSQFCEKYEYGIVVTSTWRKYPEWESCLRAAGLRESVRILGATALPDKEREEDISDYLAEHTEIEQYLVFDDDRRLLSKAIEDRDVLVCDGKHRKNLVLCNSERGFGEREYLLAVVAHTSLKYKKEHSHKKITALAEMELGLEVAAVELLYIFGFLSTATLQITLEIGYGSAVSALNRLVKKGIATTDKSDGKIKYKPIVEYEKAKELIEI